MSCVFLTRDKHDFVPGRFTRTMRANAMRFGLPGPKSAWVTTEAVAEADGHRSCLRRRQAPLLKLVGAILKPSNACHGVETIAPATMVGQKADPRKSAR